MDEARTDALQYDFFKTEGDEDIELQSLESCNDEDENSSWANGNDLRSTLAGLKDDSVCSDVAKASEDFDEDQWLLQQARESETLNAEDVLVNNLSTSSPMLLRPSHFNDHPQESNGNFWATNPNLKSGTFESFQNLGEEKIDYFGMPSTRGVNMPSSHNFNASGEREEITLQPANYAVMSGNVHHQNTHHTHNVYEEQNMYPQKFSGVPVLDGSKNVRLQNMYSNTSMDRDNLSSVSTMNSTRADGQNPYLLRMSGRTRNLAEAPQKRLYATENDILDTNTGGNVALKFNSNEYKSKRPPIPNVSRHSCDINYHNQADLGVNILPMTNQGNEFSVNHTNRFMEAGNMRGLGDAYISNNLTIQRPHATMEQFSEQIAPNKPLTIEEIEAYILSNKVNSNRRLLQSLALEDNLLQPVNLQHPNNMSRFQDSRVHDVTTHAHPEQAFMEFNNYSNVDMTMSWPQLGAALANSNVSSNALPAFPLPCYRKNLPQNSLPSAQTLKSRPASENTVIRQGNGILNTSTISAYHNEPKSFINDSLCMKKEEIMEILDLLWMNVSTGLFYVEDYYYRAMCEKYIDNYKFYPPKLRGKVSAEKKKIMPASCLQIEGLGKVVYTNVRRPKPLMDIINDTSEDDFKPLEEEPLLAARILIEDCHCVLLDIVDVDRVWEHKKEKYEDGNMQKVRYGLLDALAKTLRIPLTPSFNSSSSKGRELSDGVFQRVFELEKGRKLWAECLSKILSSLTPVDGPVAAEYGFPALRMVFITLRNIRHVYSHAPCTTANLMERNNMVYILKNISLFTTNAIYTITDPRTIINCLKALMNGDFCSDLENHIELPPMSLNCCENKKHSSPWIESIIIAIICTAGKLGLTHQPICLEPPHEIGNSDLQSLYRNSWRPLFAKLCREIKRISNYSLDALQSALETEDKEQFQLLRHGFPLKLIQSLSLLCESNEKDMLLDFSRKFNLLSD